MIIFIVIPVTVFVSGPVYNSTLYGSHKKVHWQEKPHPPLCCEENVEGYISCSKYIPGDIAFCNFFEGRPRRNVFIETRLGLNLIVYQSLIIILCMPYHLECIPEIQGAM